MGNGKPFLKEVIELDKLKLGQANVIISSCHSGKTTAALDKISTLATEKERVLYLIDTTIGKEALLKKIATAKFSASWRNDMENNAEWWGEYWGLPGVRVMTYHLFGMVLANYPDFVSGIELIICDEMHNLVKYNNIEKSTIKRAKTEWGDDIEVDTPCENAFNTIAKVVNEPNPHTIVTILTATPKKLIKELEKRGINTECFDYTTVAHADLTNKVRYYANINTVLDIIMENSERAIVYITTIKGIKEKMKYCNDGWTNVAGLWGCWNAENPLNQEQKKLREYIIKTQRIPDDIDVLFINAAYETSINIENEDLNTMVIHHSSPDVQTQVRGRLRHDIDTLYLYDSHHEHVSDYFPKEYYDCFLTREITERIVKELNLKNESGSEIKWRGIVNLLKNCGVRVEPIRRRGVRGWIVYSD